MKVVVCGRRWGKTALGLLSTVAGHGPGCCRKGALQGGKIWWVAPDYPTATEIWRDLKKAGKGCWVGKDEVERRIELPTGGAITVKSAHDPESLVAVGLDGVVIDEAAKVSEVAWYGSLRATLSDTGGWALFISTPKGFNWFHTIYERAETEPDWARWQRPTSDNPLVPPAEIEAARRDTPQYFRQEYEAQFLSTVGAEWPPEYFPPSIWFRDYPRDLTVSALALDPAMAKGEKKRSCYRAFVFAGLDRAGVCWIEAWLSRDWDANQLVDKGYELYRQMQPKCMSVETNGGQAFVLPLFRQAQREQDIGLPLYGIHNSEEKEARIRSGLGPPLARGEFRFRDTADTRLLVSQLRDFPVGEWVDGPDALEMAVRMLLWQLTGRRDAPGQPQVVQA